MHAFSPLTIRGRSLIPIVQGGMGVGISASSLSSAVARENGIGTIASVDLRHLHPDLLAQSKENPTQEKYDTLNRMALDREIQAALAQSEGRGLARGSLLHRCGGVDLGGLRVGCVGRRRPGLLGRGRSHVSPFTEPITGPGTFRTLVRPLSSPALENTD